MQPRKHFSQAPPPIKISKHFSQAANACSFPSGAPNQKSENFFFLAHATLQSLLSTKLGSQWRFYNQGEQCILAVVAHKQASSSSRKQHPHVANPLGMKYFLTLTNREKFFDCCTLFRLVFLSYWHSAWKLEHLGYTQAGKTENVYPVVMGKQNPAPPRPLDHCVSKLGGDPPWGPVTSIIILKMGRRGPFALPWTETPACMGEAAPIGYEGNDNLTGTTWGDSHREANQRPIPVATRRHSR